MEEFPGQRPGTTVFLNLEDGFLYHKDVRYECNRWVCACRTRKRRCQAELELQIDGVYHIVSGQHFHPTPDDFRDRRTFCGGLHREALNSRDPPLEVYQTICLRCVLTTNENEFPPKKSCFNSIIDQFNVFFGNNQPPVISVFNFKDSHFRPLLCH